MDAIAELNVNKVSDLVDEFATLLKVICETEPKFGVLNYYFNNLLSDFKNNVAKNEKSVKHGKRIIIKRIKEILKEAKRSKQEVLHNAEELDVEGKTILIHDHSHTVQDVLVHYKKLGRKFRVVIAEQDFDKTHANIERMHKAKIPFQVVPSYMLSHVHEQIDMLFFGAVTLKDTMNFVMSPGTASIIAEFHLVDVPTFLFFDVSKFSLWKSGERGEIFIHKHKRTHHSKPIQYDRIKYSHDRVPAKMFERVVTNMGVLNFKKLQELFEKRMKDYKL
ncbi:hypothetical protein JKY72_03075 [Candidatus Gracilibacteria bacterium]|nr:hypothetical protein [Candidatus Gracilibacteria bacterium]